MKRTASIAIFILFCGLSYGQVGAHLHGGILSGVYNNTSLTPEGSAHPGFRIGIDARLNSGRMFFTGGAHYLKFAFDPTSDGKYLKHGDSYAVQKARFGLGWNLIKIAPIVNFRAKVLGAVNLISAAKDRDLPEPYERLNDGYASIDLGVGVDVLFFTLDFEYEIGVLNAVNMESQSKLNFWSLTAGFFF